MPTRLLPPFITLRSPQSFVLELGLTLLPQHAHMNSPAGEQNNSGAQEEVSDNYVNESIPLHVGLYSVVPDLERGEAMLLFEFSWIQLQSLDMQSRVFGDPCHSATSHECTDLKQHMWNPYFGDLRCEFIDRDGKVMPGPKPRLVVDSAELAVSATFVGSCPMPETFLEMIKNEASTRTETVRKSLDFTMEEESSLSSEKPLPRMRLLRKGDPGVEPGVHVESVEGAFQEDDHWQCLGMHHFVQGDGSATECASACYQLRNTIADGGCAQWQLISGRCFVCPTPTPSWRCRPLGHAKGETARHLGWDMVVTSPAHPGHKRLITFGCSMPLFGDGNYMNRIPQWFE